MVVPLGGAAGVGLVVEHRVQPQVAVLVPHPGQHHPQQVDAALVPQHLEQADRKQPPVHAPQHLVEVGHRQREARWLAIHEGKKRQVGIEHHLHVCRRVVDLGVGKRHEPPVPGPGVVVDQLDQRHLAGDLLQIRAADGDVVAAPHQFRHPRHPRRHRRLRLRHVQRHQVLRLGQAGALQQARVVGWIVGHHDRRRPVVGVEQDAHRLGGGGIDRPAQPRHAARLHPLRGGVDQRARHRIVVHRLEEAEEAGALVVKAVVVMVDDRRHRARHRPVAARQEQLNLGVPVERVVFGVELLLEVADQRRHPRVDAPVDDPREVDETAPLGTRAHRQHGDAAGCGGGSGAHGACMVRAGSLINKPTAKLPDLPNSGIVE